MRNAGKLKTILRAASVMAILIGAPVTLSGSGRLAANDACAQGSCCPNCPNCTCYPPGGGSEANKDWHGPQGCEGG